MGTNMMFANAPQQVFSLNRLNLSDLPIGSELWKHCRGFYPSDFGEFVCVRPIKSFWFAQGGIDPLEFIYIFKHAGNGSDSSRHWHYIGFGLSDIFGYSILRRTRESDPKFTKMDQPLPELYPTSEDTMNGFGFELTARIKCNSDEEWNSEPPIWPQRLLQDLARYVFSSRNTFSVGDHVASIVDGVDGNSSRIKHILMTLDPELNQVDTALGPVKFIQIVGICTEELEAAQQWTARGVLAMMKERQETGGQMLVTDMRRGETMFELDPAKRHQLNDAIAREGSDMVQFSNLHKTSHRKPDWFTRVECGDYGMTRDEEIEAETIKPERNDQPVRTLSRMSIGSELALEFENTALHDVKYYDHVYILLGYESARILPVMIEGRLKHKRHFSFQSFKGDSLITFQPEGSNLGAVVSADQPFAKILHLHWLQIYVSERLCDEMYKSIKSDIDASPDGEWPQFPRNYSWPEFRLHLTIVDKVWEV